MRECERAAVRDWAIAIGFAVAVIFGLAMSKGHTAELDDDNPAIFWAKDRRQIVKVNLGEVGRNLQTVHASWYGGGERLARHTANGEVFRPSGLTAAHRTLPFGTRLRVCTRSSCVIVRVSDRGPAKWTGRAIDLSRGAAQKLGIIYQGTAVVTMNVL